MNDARRKAHDALGEIEIDPGALWGAQTQRARAHFDIGAEPMPHELLQALLLLKGIAANVNSQLGRLSPALAQAIGEAAAELMSGGYESQFPLSVWQSGSGTQTPHERQRGAGTAWPALRLADGGRGAAGVHANDHVNLGQSSNDMVPSAMHVAVAARRCASRLLPALDRTGRHARKRSAATACTGVIKLGRTHLQDAVPLTVGQEIGAWRSQLMTGTAPPSTATMPALHELAVGGTAVGTGLNTHPDICRRRCAAR